MGTLSSSLRCSGVVLFQNASTSMYRSYRDRCRAPPLSPPPPLFCWCFFERLRPLFAAADPEATFAPTAVLPPS